jgi:outer membrane protein TolC
MATQAHAGYRDMKQELETYSPPTYLYEKAQPTLGKEAVELDLDFAYEQQQIKKLKSRWEKSLTTEDNGYVFFRPDPELLKSMRPAATDSKAAAEALQGEFSIDILETLALLRNPTIRAAENQFRAAIESFSQVSNLDEILRQYTAFTEGIMTGVGPTKGKDSVEMKFPFPGVLALKGQVVDQEVKAARESLELTRREAITAARKTYWNLIFVRNAQEITEETIGLLRRLEAVATTRYEAGKTSFQDVIKVRIQRETLEEELITLQEKQRNFESKIREIVYLSPNTKLGSPVAFRIDKVILSLDTLYDHANAHRQELRRLRARVGKMERMIEMSETMILPPYTLNLSLYQDETINQGGSIATKDTFLTSTQVSRGAGLPKMPWYGIDDAYLRETRQKLEALREELKKAEVATADMVRNSWFELDRARREVSLYRKTVVKLSKAALDVSTRGYESGEVSFADVIASYTIWLNANLVLERKKSDFGVAWAELERILGITLN